MGFEPTPRELAAYDRNIAHANLVLGGLVDLARAEIRAGHRAQTLFDRLLDIVVPASNPRTWPSRSMSRDAALATMLIEAIRALAAVPQAPPEVPRAGFEPAPSRV